ncbi:SusC/RagA family TonB-linked outer membrane protein [Olivibacter sp. SDN3]|uniref:SusC/RagA family TonB-linked outer membrane protein n=1 Tax=Olivibacter sp. SDN3 TaxID=2764720 RepID=UPI0016517881|nr:SusC/RagA family TonB-linked outer membrane protein [Olivibacter sp. SDN3]QNL51685.1 SusC/RagA family TonB-linked outer membrane protein [Olivibacter sp. SDN3]
MMKSKLLSILFTPSFLLCLFSAHAQQAQRTITGTVKERESSLPITGVNVSLKGSTLGTGTDESGNYKLTVGAVDSALLVFSLIGYKTIEQPLGTADRYDVLMEEEANTLDEVVVIGYGEQNRATITNSISKVGAEEFAKAPGQNPLLQLQGKVAGLSLQVPSGMPGQAPQVFLRGGTSTSPEGDAPLFVVDGIISQGMRNISDMNPDDIESVQVLKDAASTAIYGAQAANGIIIIQTKRGKQGKPTINLRYTHGIEEQGSKLSLLNARDYIGLTRRNTHEFNTDNPEFFLEGGRYGMSTGNPRNSRNTLEFLDVYLNDYGQDYVNHLLNNEGWETMTDPATGRELIFQDNNFQKATFQTGQRREVDLDISGGTDKATYYFGLGYLNQDGIVRGTDYKNYSMLFNGTFKLSDNWSLNSKFSLQVRNANAPNNYEWVLARSILMPPTYRQYYEDGLPAPGEGVSSFRNRLHEIHYKTNHNDVNVYRTTVQLGATWDIIPGLKFQPTLYYFGNQGIENYFEAYNETVTDRPASANHNFDRHLQLDALLSYTKSFADQHNLDVVVGTSINHDYAYRMNGSGREALTDYIPTLNATAQLTQRVGTTKTYDAMLSYFGRANYDYKGKYMAAVNLRVDGSSRFAESHRFGYFPGLSAGWNLHREDFFQPLTTTLSSLKLRASYGITGNNSLSIFDTRGRYTTGNIYQGEAGVLNTVLINSNLVWENTTAFDIGMDIGLAKDRISILLDYYNKLTDRRLFDKPLWASTGFGAIRSNFGSLRNRGFEVEISANAIRKTNFSWDISATFSYNRSTIVELPENEEDKNRVGGNWVYDPAAGTEIKVGGFAEGERFGQRWAYNYQGVYQTDEEAAGAPQDPNAAGRTKVAGDAIFEDVNGDGILDNRDMVFMGYIRPDKMGGLVNSFRYKNFSARLVVDWSMGHVIDNGFKGYIMGSSRNNNNAIEEALHDSWQYTGHDAAYPRYTVSSDYDYNWRNHNRWDNNVGNASGGTNNSLYYKKGDFLAFRELSFSYQLRTDFLRRISIQGLELFAGMYNIGYITAYDGFMPEIYEGHDWGTYPRPRQTTFGLKATF